MPWSWQHLKRIVVAKSITLIHALLSGFALTPTLVSKAQLFVHPLSFLLVPFSSVRLAQHLRPALSSMPIGKNFPFFHLLGLPQNA